MMSSKETPNIAVSDTTAGVGGILKFLGNDE